MPAHLRLIIPQAIRTNAPQPEAAAITQVSGNFKIILQPSTPLAEKFRRASCISTKHLVNTNSCPVKAQPRWFERRPGARRPPVNLPRASAGPWRGYGICCRSTQPTARGSSRLPGADLQHQGLKAGVNQPRGAPAAESGVRCNRADTGPRARIRCDAAKISAGPAAGRRINPQQETFLGNVRSEGVADAGACIPAESQQSPAKQVA